MRLVHRNIDEPPTRQAHLRRTRRVRTAFTPLEHPGRRQQLGAMADRRNRLVRLVESFDQRQHLLIQAQVLRRTAAWDQQRVVTLGAHLHEVEVQREVMPWLLAVGLIALEIVDRGTHGLPGDFLRAHRMHRVTDHLQGLERHHRFVVFDVIAHQHENLLRRHRIHSVSCMGTILHDSPLLCVWVSAAGLSRADRAD
ncbi:hypothetical protein D3C81_1176550 [compost metagenome]